MTEASDPNPIGDDVEQARQVARASAAADAGIGTFVVRDLRRIVVPDAGAAALLGRSPAELEALADVASVVRLDERYKVDAERHRVVSVGVQVDEVDVVIERPDGTSVPLRAFIVPADDEGHDVAVAIRRLVTDDQERQRERIQAIGAALGVGFALWDVDDPTEPGSARLLWANEAARAVLDVTHPHPTITEALRDDRDTWDTTARLSGTLDVEPLGDLVLGDPTMPDRVFQRIAVGLPGGDVIHLLFDVSDQYLGDVTRRQLIERLVEVTDGQRAALAMGVHDDPVQQLAAASMMLHRLGHQTDADDVTELVGRIHATVQEAISGLRRVAFELHPPEPDGDLPTVLRTATDFLFAETSIRADVDIGDEVPDQLDHELVTAAYRIAVEAMSNARQHSGASTVQISVDRRRNDLVVAVSDDGAGFEGVAPTGHFGLRIMTERAMAVGGRCDIDPSDGTVVRAVLPLRPPADVRRLTDDADLHADDPAAAQRAVERERDRLRHELRRVEAEAKRTRTRLGSTGELGARLREVDGDPVEVARLGVRYVADVVGDGCALRWRSTDGRWLRPVASWHASPAMRAFIDRYMLPDRDLEQLSTAGGVYLSGEPTLVDRAAGWPAVDGELPPSPLPVVSGAVVPLDLGREVVGVLGVIRTGASPPLTGDDVTWVQSLGDRIALALIGRGYAGPEPPR